MFLLRIGKKTPIADLVVGEMKTLKGVVQSRQRLTVPPSGTDCVYYYLLQEVYKTGDRGRGRPLWFVEKREAKCAEFALSDGTGTIVVRSRGEDVKISGTHEEMGNVKNNRKRRYSAQLIIPGDEIIVRGQVASTEKKDELVVTPPPNGLLKIAVVRRA